MKRVEFGLDFGLAGGLCLDRRSSSAMPTACLTHIGREMKRERGRVSPLTLHFLVTSFFSALSLSLFSVINTYTETFICLCMYMLHFFTVIVPRINTIPFDPPYDPLSCRAALPFECINRCVFLLFSNLIATILGPCGCPVFPLLFSLFSVVSSLPFPSLQLIILQLENRSLS